jgi:hypothetical protein
MKKLLITLGLAIGLTANAAVVSTNVASGSQAFLLLSGAVNVYQIQISSDVACTVDFYDAVQLTAPVFGTNYTNASFVSRVSYASNGIVTQNIGATGTTNYLTNNYIYTLLVTNAATTNVLPKQASIAVAAGESVVADVAFTTTKGITYRPTTNVSVILYYRPNR